jgi:hypothetical protein
MNRHRHLIQLAIGFAFALALQPGPVAAAGPAVQVQADPGDAGTWQLQATVTGADGKAQSQAAVTFVAATDFFGERWVPIGSALTDTSGRATVVYTPTWNGEQRLVARVSGVEGARASEPIVIEVSGALPGIASEPQDLPIVRAWALPIGVAVVVLVWLVLAFIFLSAVIGIARRPTTPTTSQPARGETGMQPVDSTANGGSRR